MSETVEYLHNGSLRLIYLMYFRNFMKGYTLYIVTGFRYLGFVLGFL